MELWRRRPQEFLKEILEHAKTQKEGEDLVAVGGMHTSIAVNNVIVLIEEGQCPNPGLTDIPDAWLNWPCVAYFFEDDLSNHWQELIALGNIDNESLALQVSFVDKLIKLRELFLVTFKTVEKYKEAANESKSAKANKEASKKIAQFRENVERALQIKPGYLGHMLSIVANDEVTWGLYLRIIKRDTKAPPTTSHKKDIARKPAAPMKSCNDLLPFLNLPPSKLKEILGDVVEGNMSFKSAKELADVYNSKARLLRELENRFNKKSGVTNTTRAKKQGVWTSYNQIVEQLPDVPRNLEVWMVPFGKSKLNAVEAQNFDLWVDKIYDAYQDAKVGRRKTAVQSVPHQFVVGMVKEVQQGEGAQRWAVVEALGGATNAALVINDRTENLKAYLKPKDSKFGKIFFYPYLLSSIVL